MLDSSRLWWTLLGAFVAACAAPEPSVTPAPQPAPVVAAPPAPAQPTPAPGPAARAEEARALLAQAETDVQRARAKRALWSKAWENLIAARRAVAAQDFAGAIPYARRASEFAQLGLDQLAYPAVQ